MNKAITTILLLVGLSTIVNAQCPVLETEHYSFTHFDQNRIQFPADSTTFNHLFAAIDTLRTHGEGTINMVHIGGSHVQAGVLTHQLRKNLHLITPQQRPTGLGMIFPFKAAKTNNPAGFKTSYTGEWTSYRSLKTTQNKALGLTGIAISTCNPLSTITITSNTSSRGDSVPHAKFNEVKVFGYAESDSTELLLTTSTDTLLGTPPSIQAPYYTFTLAAHTDSIRLAFRKLTGEFTLTAIVLNDTTPGINVHGIGINGASLSAYSRCTHLERDLAEVHPDLMIFAIGINDAVGVNFNKERFVEQYRKLIDEVLAINPHCALLFVTNNDSFRRHRRGYQVNRNGEVVREAFFQLASEYNGGVWDLFQIMGGLRSMQKWEMESLSKRDKIHFTQKGYTLLGNLLYNAIATQYNEYHNRTNE